MNMQCRLFNKKNFNFIFILSESDFDKIIKNHMISKYYDTL